MSEEDLRCPGCTSFNKEISSGCIFRDLKQEEKKDTIKCDSCGKEIDAKRLRSDKSLQGNTVCPECGKEIII